MSQEGAFLSAFLDIGIQPVHSQYNDTFQVLLTTVHINANKIYT